MDREQMPLSSIKDAKVRRKLAHLCEAYREVQDEIRAHGEVKKALMKEITGVADDAEIKQPVVGEGWLLTKRNTPARLNKQLLLENGVTIEQIEKSTVWDGKQYYQVLEKKS